jgi:fumarate hydratase class I
MSTPLPAFEFQEILSLGKDDAPYRLLTADGVSTFEAAGRTFLRVEPRVLTLLTREAMRDMAHLFRPGHLSQLAAILKDPEASPNDRFVALELLKNANIAAGGVLPSCQDTGTAIVMGKKGQLVFTGGGDEEAISRGIFETYTRSALRYSQLAALDLYKEVNTGSNLPAQIEIAATDGDEYKFLFIAKGGGSANKSYLYQQTKALLNPETLIKFIEEKVRSLGTAACPPYHLAIVIGGTSAEYTLKVAKLASTRYLDRLPPDGNKLGRAFRDSGLEQKVLDVTRRTGIGAQFGGKYFCHDVRVIRLPRPRRLLPRGDRRLLLRRPSGARKDHEGRRIPRTARDRSRQVPAGRLRTGRPGRRGPDRPPPPHEGDPRSAHPPSDPDAALAHRSDGRGARHRPREDQGAAGSGRADARLFPGAYGLLRRAGQDPEGLPSGSFGPTTAGRMDAYVDLFQSKGGSLVMLAKGNRSVSVREACKKHGGFYLGSIGGPAARLAKDCIRKVEVLEYPSSGWRRCGRSTSSTSRPSRSSTTRGTTSSPA